MCIHHNSDHYDIRTYCFRFFCSLPTALRNALSNGSTRDSRITLQPRGAENKSTASDFDGFKPQSFPVLLLRAGQGRGGDGGRIKPQCRRSKRKKKNQKKERNNNNNSNNNHHPKPNNHHHQQKRKEKKKKERKERKRENRRR